MPVETPAVVVHAPHALALERVPLSEIGDEDVLVDVAWSGISTGTERLLFEGRMPSFPGMGYPLIPGYEAVGTVVEAGSKAGRHEGQTVFVPGARCYGPIRGLFGGAAGRMVVPGARAAPIPDGLEDRGVLLALAATAFHAFADHTPPELIVGHGVLGRLVARLTVLAGGPAPVVWEHQEARQSGGNGYRVVGPEQDDRRDYAVICDASGDVGLLDTLLARLAKGGELVLAGFYDQRISFAFPPAFMREARLRIAAEWQAADLEAVTALVAEGALSLDGLISHRSPAGDAATAYRTAFDDPACLKMLLDWRGCA